MIRLLHLPLRCAIICHTSTPAVQTSSAFGFNPPSGTHCLLTLELISDANALNQLLNLQLCLTNALEGTQKHQNQASDTQDCSVQCRRSQFRFALPCDNKQLSYSTESARRMLQLQYSSVESAILRAWVTLRLNFRLKGYVLRQYLWTVRWLSLIHI